jgi:hypothetical protein
MTTMSVLDTAGRRRSPATLPGYHAGLPRSGSLQVPHAHAREDVQRHRRESRSRGGRDSRRSGHFLGRF